MYHYVRPGPLGLPYLRYLHRDNFRRQLDWLAENVGFTSRNDFEASIASGEPARGAVLTFDDALADHYDHVLPELVARGLWGIFYVPTGIYRSQRLLDVHRLHVILGGAGGVAAIGAVRQVISEDMLDQQHVEEFHKATYLGFDDDAATMAFKRTMNYFIAYQHREDAIDEIAKALAIDMPAINAFYISLDRLREMHRAGMVIGSHSVNHLVMSKLSTAEQQREITDSFADLSSAIAAPIETFCYPYGGFRTFTAETERLLGDAGCRYAFNVEFRDIEPADLRKRPQALPRYDCNQFPHGEAERHR